MPRQGWISGQLPRLRPRWGDKVEAQRARPGHRVSLRNASCSGGERTSSRRPPAAPHWPGPGPTTQPAEASRAGVGAGCRGGHLGLQLLLLAADLLLHLLMELLDLLVVLRVPPGRGGRGRWARQPLSTRGPCCWWGWSGPGSGVHPAAPLTLSVVTDPSHPESIHPNNSPQPVRS